MSVNRSRLAVLSVVALVVISCDKKPPTDPFEAEPVNDFETPSRLSLLSTATRGGHLEAGD
jgi:hypothetical protein